jgi:dipeptidyl aminopeptidase/acylaminoacyl peptidase
MATDDPLAHVMNAQLVYHLPGEERTSVMKHVPFKTADGLTLHLDAYLPADLKSAETRPAVIFVSGDTPPEYMLGVKNWGVYVGWGQLVAASGLIGIPFQHRVMGDLHPSHLDGVVQDVADAVAYVRTHAADLHVDPDRLCIWAGSAGALAGLRVALVDPQPSIRCLVSYYGLFDLALYAQMRELPAPAPVVLEAFSPLTYLHRHPERIPPLFIARMEHDIPGLNIAVDAFAAAATAVQAHVEVMNHPDGHHGLDTEDDDEQSRAIIAQTLRFMHRHLDHTVAQRQ